MLFPVKQLLEGKEPVRSITTSAQVRDALSLMIQNDFSQLPIVDDTGDLVAIITEQNIIRTYFHTSDAVSVLDLRVDNCQTKPHTLSKDADIFEALDRLEKVYAIVIIDERKPMGILTAYDTTHFFRDLSEGLILVQDIETTLRQYIESVFSDEHSRQAALLRAFRHDKQDPTKPAKEYNELSFGEHIQLITTEHNWDRLESYLAPKEMFIQLMTQVGQIRNQLSHFRGRIQPIQFDALVRSRDWLSSRAKPSAAGVREIHKSDIRIPGLKEGEGKYGPLQEWLQEQNKAGETSLRIKFEEIERILQDSLPPSARDHRSWWANDFSTHVQAIAWLSSGWLVDDADLEKAEIVFRQSVSALYPGFFKTMLDQLKEKRPGLTQVNRVFVQNWIELSAGRTGFSFVWSLPREGVSGGALRVELDFNTGDKTRNKETFESLKCSERDIETQIGLPLIWEKLENRKMSRLSASMLFRLATATPDEIQAAQSWGVRTMLKFVDVLTPHVKGF